MGGGRQRSEIKKKLQALKGKHEKNQATIGLLVSTHKKTIKGNKDTEWTRNEVQQAAMEERNWETS